MWLIKSNKITSAMTNVNNIVDKVVVANGDNNDDSGRNSNMIIEVISEVISDRCKMSY